MICGCLFTCTLYRFATSFPMNIFESILAVNLEIFHFSYLIPLLFSSLTIVAPPSSPPSSPSISPSFSTATFSTATFLLGGATVASRDDLARFLTLLQGLGGDLGTVEGFLEELEGIVDQQLTWMFVDSGG